MGAKYNVRDLRKKRTQQHWANCNGGNLQYGRIAIRPYDARKGTHTMPVMLFCVFTLYSCIFANVLITHT